MPRELTISSRLCPLEARRARLVGLRNRARHGERTWIDERLEEMLLLVVAEIIELEAGPDTGPSEVEEQARREADGTNQGVDTAPMPRHDVRDAFNTPSGAEPTPLTGEVTPAGMVEKLREHERDLEARALRGSPGANDALASVRNDLTHYQRRHGRDLWAHLLAHAATFTAAAPACRRSGNRAPRSRRLVTHRASRGGKPPSEPDDESDDVKPGGRP
jgi:hypothetical protein